MEFSRVLREVRQRMGITQAEMANRLGVARASLSLYEAGKQTPDLTFLDRLHRETGMSFDYLMGYTDNYTPETLGMDKVVGLSTESLERLKTMPDIDRQLIDSLIKSDRLPRLLQIALRTASLIYLYNKNIAQKYDNAHLEASVILYEKQLGEVMAEAIAGSPGNGEMLKAAAVISLYEIMSNLYHESPENEQKEMAAYWKQRMDSGVDTFIKTRIQGNGVTDDAEKEAGGE